MHYAYPSRGDACAAFWTYIHYCGVDKKSKMIKDACTIPRTAQAAHILEGENLSGAHSSAALES